MKGERAGGCGRRAGYERQSVGRTKGKDRKGDSLLEESDMRAVGGDDENEIDGQLRSQANEEVGRRKRQPDAGAMRDEGSCIGFNRVIVIVPGGSKGKAPVNARGGDRVVEDAENRVCIRGLGRRVAGGCEKLVGKAGPVRAANRAGDAAVANVGGDAGEVKGVRALAGEYGWQAAASSSIEEKGFQTNGA